MKKEELISDYYNEVNNMQLRIKSGEVIEDIIHPCGDRIVVTKTDVGTYGYMVFPDGENEPNYYAESVMLIPNLNTMTDSNGIGLQYLIGQSVVSRNLIGRFCEYRKDPVTQTDAYYECIKMPPDSPLQLRQRMAGYYESDAITVFSVDFIRKTISVAADAQILQDDKSTAVRVGMTLVDDDLQLDYEHSFKMLKEAEEAKAFMGRDAMSDKELLDMHQKSAHNAQALFSDVYLNNGLPISPDVEMLLSNPNSKESILAELLSSENKSVINGALSDGTKK